MIHNISYRLMVYGTEDEGKVLEALRNIIPGAAPEREMAEGYHGNPITVLRGRVDRRRALREFMEKFIEVFRGRMDELEGRFDENGNLFIRLDKQEALEGIWKPVRHGDAIHLKIKVEAYPAKRDVAAENIRKLLE
ncbi:RNA-binding protein [Methanothermobacter sp. KEPCO-1]|uniref:RNA-binding protein n=1 Tax=Methanothermobacter TaxID=145260 RepID=UPI0011C78310|nr:RNA-binding protein [Methanothermobacter sp. KEPCO-1]QEF95114.1 RNA-binding protein [Methanothermobacter sp. KEPCO-1]